MSRRQSKSTKALSQSACRFNYDAFQAADILAERTLISSTRILGIPVPVGRGIRIFEDISLKRRYGLDYPEARHNHNALVIPPYKSELHTWTVGEAIAQGSVETPLSDYEKLMQEGACELDFYRVTGYQDTDMPLSQGDKAVERWFEKVKGTPYDYPGIVFCAMACLWTPGEGVLYLYKLLIRRKLILCTYGVIVALVASLPPGSPDVAPMPFHIQQMAGELPDSGLTVCLRNITTEIVVPA